MVRVEIKMSALTAWINGLARRVERAVVNGLEKSSRKLAYNYREDISNGRDAAGAAMRPVKDSTMNMPIRMTSDRRIRSTVNPSASKAMAATGATANSIREKKVNAYEYIIRSSTAHGNNVLTSNAYPSKANKGAIKGDRVRRDPLQVTSKQMDVIEDYILKQLDKVLI